MTITGESYSFSLFVDAQRQPEILNLNIWDRIWKVFSVLFGVEDGYKATGFFDWFAGFGENIPIFCANPSKV